MSGVLGWHSTAGEPAWLSPVAALRRLTKPVYVVKDGTGCRYAADGGAASEGTPGAKALLAWSPPMHPSRLGAAFCACHGLQYPLYAGSMAHGIASEALVETMARNGMLGFYGAAGEAPDRIEAALVRIKQQLAGLPFGFNLINSPNAPAWERAVADIYLRQGLRLVEASAYIMLTPPLVKYRVKGIHRLPNGRVSAPNRVIAKVSRVEIAERFFAPPPEKLLRRLVEAGEITQEEALLAVEIPMAGDVTAESDSGGHTDHRAALAMMPGLLRLRDEMQAKHGYSEPLRVGLAGGIATPHAVAAAFALGAAYVVTGSINQACVESGSSAVVRDMLARAAQTDVAQAPAADMFEMGVTVQVLKKGVRFAERAGKLYDYYRRYASLEEIPVEDRRKLEETLFRAPLETIWAETESFFAQRDPSQVEKAAANPRHKMALVFRWYLGQASGWANRGVAGREEDYQIWCGPGMGAFNDWVRGSFMEPVAGRQAALAAKNLLFHGAVLMRAAVLRGQGVDVALPPESLFPLSGEVLDGYLADDLEGVQA